MKLKPVNEGVASGGRLDHFLTKYPPIIVELLTFIVPIILGNLSNVLITTGDMVVAARYSTETAAAVSTSLGFVGPLYMMAIGLTMGISPLLAFHKISKVSAARDRNSVMFVTTLAYGLGVGMAMLLVGYLAIPLLKFMDYDPLLLALLQDYLPLVLWIIPLTSLFSAFKEYEQALGQTVYANGLSMMSVCLNISLNLLFAFTFSMGIKGIALGSVLTKIVLLLLYFYRYRSIGGSLLRLRGKIGDFVDSKFLRELWRQNVFIALSVLFEVTAFALVTLLIGKMGVVPAAASGIVLNMASLTFMVPSAIAAGLSTKVGAAYADRLIQRISDYTLAGLGLSTGFMLVSGLTFTFGAHFLFSLFTDDLSVIEYGLVIMVIVAGFQLFDGIQVTLSGVLRGLGKAHVSTVVALFGYWLIGLPLGMYLAYQRDMQASGLWLGLAMALAMVSIGLAAYLRNFFRTQLKQ